MNGQASSPKGMQDFYTDFKNFMYASDEGAAYLNGLQMSMFTGIEKKKGKEPGSIAHHMMRGDFSNYIMTLAIEEMFSEAHGPNEHIVNEFIDQTAVGEYQKGLVAYIRAYKGSKIELIHVSRENNGKNKGSCVGVLKNGRITEHVNLQEHINIEQEQAFYLARIIRAERWQTITGVFLGLSEEEVAYAASDENISEFELWVERILDSECKDCEACTKRNIRLYEIAEKTFETITFALHLGEDEKRIKPLKDCLYDSPLQSTILSIRKGVNDPRKLGDIVRWIKSVEAKMKADTDTHAIDTSWIWEDLNLQGVRDTQLH